MTTKLILWWSLLAVIVGVIVYYFSKWLFNREGPGQTEDDRDKELAEISNNNSADNVNYGGEDYY